MPDNNLEDCLQAAYFEGLEKKAEAAQAYVARLEAQCDELAGALRDIAENEPTYLNELGLFHRCQDVARAALAKLEEKDDG